jgi:multiple sugar transport system permease protein
MTTLMAKRPVALRGGRSPVARRGWLFLIPLLVVVGAWIYLPLGATTVLAFLDWRLVGDPEPAGWDNFVALFRDPHFLPSVLQTLAYAVGLLPFATVVPLLLAIALWSRPGRAATTYRALLFLPVMVAPTALAISWYFLLNPLEGLVNSLLETVGIPGAYWLGDPRTALPVIVVVTAARVVAFNLLLYSAALEGLDRRLVAAARLEGASRWEVTRFVVLPQLTTTTIMLALLSVVLAGQWAFTNVAVLTSGEPDGTTDNIYHLIYEYGFDFFETGMASAASLLVLVALLILAVGWSLLGRRRAKA